MLINPLTQLVPAMIGLAAAALYAAAAASLRGARRPWPSRRTISFLTGVALVTGGFLAPGVAGEAGHDPGLHMTVHLLLAMAGPLLIAVSAPVTLAFRTLRPAARRRLAALLASSPARLIGHPLVAVVLSAGGLYALYLTPLHALALHDPALGVLVQAHLVASGTVFAWAVVGLDHVPRRPSLAMRGAALVLGLLLHTLLSRLLVAEADRLALQAGGSAVEWGRAAEIMWYEGDLIELAFLVAFVVQAWPPRRPAQKGLTARALGIDAA